MDQKFTLTLLFVFLASGIVSAGTVSITGTCQSTLLKGNQLNFTLLNTGDEAAYNLILSPFISGAQAQNSSYPVGTLGPSSGITTLITLVNLSATGTYTDYFVLTYQQGTSAFTALFPCLVNIAKPATSGIYLTVENTTVDGGRATINVSVFNGVRENFTVNVSALLSPAFTFLSQKSYVLDIGPYQTKNLQFHVSYPQGQANYAGAISASYVAQNQSHSSFVTIAINTHAAAQNNSVSYTLWGAAALVAVLLILIARAALKRRKNDHAKSA